MPFMGESVTDGTLANFLKSMHLSLSVIQVVNVYAPDMLFAAEAGDRVEADEAIAQIETDKVMLWLIHSHFNTCF